MANSKVVPSGVPASVLVQDGQPSKRGPYAKADRSVSVMMLQVDVFEPWFAETADESSEQE